MSEQHKKLVVTLGRGKTGKSVFLRWVAEDARARSQDVRVIDADPDNKALSSCFDDAAVLPPGDDEDRRAWLEARLGEMVEAAATGHGYHAVLDVGGNDRLLRSLGAELDLVEMLAGKGIDVVAVHMVGPDMADLRYLAALEDSGALAPRSLVVALNAGLLRAGQSAATAFAPIMDSEVVKRVVSPSRGGRCVVVPALTCLPSLESKGLTSLRAAAAAVQEIGMFNARRVGFWLDRDMAEVRGELADCLP